MRNYLAVLLLLMSSSLFAQTISGRVTDGNNEEALVGANVYWLGSNDGTVTDAEGRFELLIPTLDTKQLIASFVGYTPDTISISNETAITFRLKVEALLDEVIVQDRKEGVIISSINAIKSENITSTELRKAACCDLAGCFETQTSVSPQVTNVVTNAKELRIAGLSGVYNQVLIDGFPMIQGLSYTYGISSVPGTLVENIYVAKGANSVLQGFESISGQINVITKDPDLEAPLFLNAYLNSFGERQFNADASFKIGDFKNLLAVHVVQPAGVFDRDKDAFLDVPKLTRYLVSNKLKFGREGEWGWNGEVMLRYLNEERAGGQTQFNPRTDRGSNSIYGQVVKISQPELIARTNYKFDDDNNFLFQVSGFYQDQDSWFGTVNYSANQTNLYANFEYERYYSTQNYFKTGLSYRHLNLEEDIAFSDNPLNRTYAGNYQRTEHIPGVFAENSIQLMKGKLTWMLGLRGDHHNQFGFKFTPRTLLKLDINKFTVLRANAGRGWRTVNLFSENIGLMVSSRDVVFAEALEPEEANNFGLNLTHKIERTNFSGYLSADFYYSTFQNQVFPDYDADPTQAIIQNFRGTSISNSLQLESGFRFWKTLEFKLGYSFLDVYRKEGEVKELLPFNPRHKILTVLGYRPVSNKFQIDANMHWYGQRRLPNTSLNPEAFQRPDFSETYAVISAQFTYNFDLFEIYAGCENIFDFRQEQPILSWQNPFGPYFDTSSVWGPTRGREFYLGVRYSIVKE